MNGLDRTRSARLGRLFLVPLLLVVASIAFVSTNAAQHERMSPYDEYVYIDYLAKFPEQGLIHRGESTGDLAREYYSCYGVEIFGKASPENCSTGEFDEDSDYPIGGKNSADIYTPLYFGATWVVAQPIMWVTGSNLVEAGRLAGAAWLGAAAVVFYFALGRLKLTLAARIAAPFALIASVSAWWANTYISTDATAFLAGATLLLLGLRYVQTGRGAWPLIISSVLAVALKFQNLMAVAAVVGFLLFTLIGQARSGRSSSLTEERLQSIRLSNKSTLVTAASMVALPIIFQVAWMSVIKMVAVGPSGSHGEGSSMTINAMITESLKFFGSINASLPVNSAATVGWSLSVIASWLLVAGVVGLIASSPRWSTEYSLAVSWLLVIFAGGPALALATRLMAGAYIPLPVRYGLSLLPIGIALTAALLDKKIETRVVFAGIALVTFVASLTPFYPGAEMFG